MNYSIIFRVSNLQFPFQTLSKQMAKSKVRMGKSQEKDTCNEILKVFGPSTSDWVVQSPRIPLLVRAVVSKGHQKVTQSWHWKNCSSRVMDMAYFVAILRDINHGLVKSLKRRGGPCSCFQQRDGLGTHLSGALQLGLSIHRGPMLRSFIWVEMLPTLVQ